MPDPAPHHDHASADQPENEPVTDEGVEAETGVFERLGPAAWLGVAWAVMPALGGFVLLYNIRPVSEWLVSLGNGGVALYAGVFIVAAGLGLLPTYAQAFLGGWAFGPVVGTLAALLGFVGASCLGRPIATRIGQDRVDAELGRNRRARAVRDALVGSGPIKTLGIVTLVRVPPNSPFSLTNLVLSTTRVPWWIYIVGTAVGMLPRTALVVWIASHVEGELTKEAMKQAREPWMLWVSVLAALAVLLTLAHIGNKAIEKVTAQDDGTDDQPDDGPGDAGA
jgi:uncharacterized membrane protein YdjX (TVP38/TMEM64 family)